MKRKKYKLERNDLIELKEMGYEVHEFTPWHFRVWKDRDEKYVDVFPTTHVYCYYEENEYKGKGEYDSMMDLIEDKLDYFK